jgi:hypothetical protein
MFEHFLLQVVDVPLTEVLIDRIRANVPVYKFSMGFAITSPEEVVKTAVARLILLERAGINN